MKQGPVPFIAKPGTVVTPEGYNENVRKVADYLNDVTAYRYVYSTITYPLHNIDAADPWWKRSWVISPPTFGDAAAGAADWADNFGIEISSVHMVVFNAQEGVDYSADWITQDIGAGVPTGLCEPLSVNTQDRYTSSARNSIGGVVESHADIVMPGGATSEAGSLRWVTAKLPVASDVAEGISQKVFNISHPPSPGTQKYYAFTVNGEYGEPGEDPAVGPAEAYGYLNVTIRCKKYLSPDYLAPAGSKTGQDINADNLNEAFERAGTGLNARNADILNSEKDQSFVKCMVMSSKSRFRPASNPKGSPNERLCRLLRATPSVGGDLDTEIVGIQVGIAANLEFSTTTNGPPRGWPWFTAAVTDASGVPAVGRPYATASQEDGFFWGFGTTDFWDPPPSGNDNLSTSAPAADASDPSRDFFLRWGFDLYDTAGAGNLNQDIDHFYIYVWYR